METKQFGNTDMKITRIGFGAWAIGGGNWAFGWGPQDDAEAVGAIKKAVEVGMNWIDTAAVYGLGHSEELVGKAIKGMQQKPYIFTKCGLVWDENRRTGQSLKAKSIRKECENSLRRLDVDVIDLYQVHWPVEEDIEEAWEMMATLKEEGKVRWIGVSNFNIEQMKRCLAIAPVSSLQPPYSLISRDYEKEILPWCLEQNIGVIVYSPMGSGLLTGTMTRERIQAMPADDWRKKSPFFNEPMLSKNLALADKLRVIGESQGYSAGEVAIAWTLHNPAVTAAIVGGRSAEQVEGICRAEEVGISEEEKMML
ncbi:MAG TPA: aldo/keto reductase [Bacteroidales bacterium]|jgi:aryl-alcohol dehydrogenase-like predicted oxidoreductase|nr:aldo/keto reductase [Bacteroidales bacterium]HOX77881.1 aldo/keto reductase [Bacteroidales bacterium]HPI84943.1 aldo/keto reductase [Bacteroidales bacterium]HPM92854.1 aldo/keto reductase [Bacteroidales bacterium]